MKSVPTLYDAKTTDFETLGIGKLKDAKSCVVEETYNDEYTVTLEVPFGGACYNDITVGNIIAAVPEKYTDDREIFEIITTTADTTAGTIVAVGRQYALQRMRSIIVGPIAKTGKVTVDKVFEKVRAAMLNAPGAGEVPITFWSDVDIQNEWENKIPTTLYDCLFTEETGILACYGGELSYHYGEIRLNKNRGADRGQTVKYGRNLLNMSATVDQSEVVSGICAYYAKENEAGQTNVIMGTKKIIEVERPEGAEDSDYTRYPHIIPIDATSYIAAPTGASNEWTPTPAMVQEWAELYVAINYTGTIPLTISAGVVEDPKYAMEREMHLADTVRLYNPLMNINVAAKIVRTAYNCLSDEWEGVDVGSVRANLAQTIVDMMAQKDKITQIYTGGGNSGNEGNWSWSIDSSGNSATLQYSQSLQNVKCKAYSSGIYYYEVTVTMPQYFSSWDVNTSSLAYSFTGTDWDSAYTRVYLRGYDQSAKSVTLWLITTTATLSGTLTGSARVTKSS